MAKCFKCKIEFFAYPEETEKILREIPHALFCKSCAEASGIYYNLFERAKLKDLPSKAEIIYKKADQQDEET